MSQREILFCYVPRNVFVKRESPRKAVCCCRCLCGLTYCTRSSRPSQDFPALACTAVAERQSVPGSGTNRYSIFFLPVCVATLRFLNCTQVSESVTFIPIHSCYLLATQIVTGNTWEQFWKASFTWLSRLSSFLELRPHSISPHHWKPEADGVPWEMGEYHKDQPPESEQVTKAPGDSWARYLLILAVQH